jgi:hypothetical protein
MPRITCIDYEELWAERCSQPELVEEIPALPKLANCVAPEPQDHEEAIARYLETAPAHSAMGKVVGDALDPNAKVFLFPGSNTDGVFEWPSELAYYVRKYHVRVPQVLIERMVSQSWRPPREEEIDWVAFRLAINSDEPTDC